MSIVHYWACDEATGSTTSDLVGDLGAASVVGDTAGDTIIAAPTGFGNARNLEAPVGRAYLDLYTGDSDSGTYELTTWSLTCRVMRDGTPPTDYPYVWMCGTPNTANSVEIYLDFDGFTMPNGIGVNTRNNSNGYAGVSGAAATDLANGAWHRITLTNDGTTLKLYQGASLIDSAAIAAPIKILPKSQTLEIGRYGSTNYAYFAVDDIAIYDHALTTEEIEAPAFLSDPVWTEPVFEEPAWVSLVDPLLSRIYYVCDVDDEILDPIRLPISSWQGTLQSDRSSFLQAVVPAALPFADALEARGTGEFIISRGVVLPSGTIEEVEIMRAPMRLRLDIGPTNATGTLTGYTTVAAGLVKTRTLTNVRSQSIDGDTRRFRCDIDWFLRPGDTAVYGDDSITVAYINYIAGAQDQYMDVGNRAL